MVVDPQVMPIARRLQQEIEALGLTVQIIAADSAHAPSLKEQALTVGAVAAIHLAPTGGGDVDMTILDGATGKTVSWQIVASTPEAPAPLDLTATRTVELLRASLLELAARRAALANAAARPRPSPAVARPPAAAARGTRESLSLSVAPALLYSAHFRPGALLESSATWLPISHFGLHFSALLPMLALKLEDSAGSVDLFASLFRLAPVAHIGAPASAVSLRCAAGLELDVLRFEGDALAPYLSATNTRTVWSPFASAATRFRMAASWAVVTELAVALAYPSTIVRIADREAATWGRPLATGSVGLELTWPSAVRP